MILIKNYSNIDTSGEHQSLTVKLHLTVTLLLRPHILASMLETLMHEAISYLVTSLPLPSRQHVHSKATLLRDSF